MFQAVVHGFILAFGLILPLGVQNVFIFNQGALQKRFVHALPAVITASVCDTLLISLAVLGVSALVLGNFWVKTVLLISGILFLSYMGWTTWNSKAPQDLSNSKTIFKPKKQIAFAASVSLLNPHAILDTIGVIGTSSLAYSGSQKIIFAVSCSVVSWMWFAGLAAIGRIVGQVDRSGRFILILNKVSALVIWGAAIYMFLFLIS
ncbi:LysE/ArgO family amino acid transporter [Effusibacillus dendaii]|uniref:Putative amino-acid transporter YisU n=1 Tax=Effusibacillus dendaii TaxID=2743772 RepID=A0A7I8D9Q3_9BACL|nr:LysE/ArgO family amino acid transporter [Effusibacillus dendaii]BCJ85709.1 putative amino-acid transporter YisU [Effusibacillus dendaii]